MLRQLLYPFLPYRSLFAPMLLVAAIVLPCWLAFRFHRLRASGRRPSLGRELLLLVFVAYLAGLAAATLLPNRPSRAVAEAMARIELRPDPAALTCSAATMPDGSPARGFCVRNARGNLLLFVPLGFLLPLVWPRLGFRRGMLVATGVSVGIEAAQYVSRAWGSYRLADVNDVILNVLGASLGLLLVLALRSLRRGTRPSMARVSGTT